MVDGFHWTRVTSKQLRFLYEEITTLPPPQKMKELADAIDRGLAAASGATDPARAAQRCARNPEPAYPVTLRHIRALKADTRIGSQSASVRQLAWRWCSAEPAPAP